jgi:hypothetical protein
MNREQLKAQLNSLGVDPNAYSLSGGLPNEQYVLGEEANGQWGVYYSERGLKTGLRLFDSESSACSFFLEKITRDLGIKRQ